MYYFKYISPREFGMYQFYFLSIVCNLLAGLALASETLEGRIPSLVEISRELSAKSGFLLGLGGAAFIVGFFKLLSVTAGDVPVVGDLFPAAAGLTAGGTLLLEYYRERSKVTSPFLNSLESVLVKNKNLWGLAGILSAVLHFFFPGVLFL
jgi:hypothetical protein